MATCGSSPLLPSKLAPLDNGAGGTYAPAPLNATSLWNGVAKYCHDQYPIPSNFIPFALGYLDWLFPLAYGRGETSLDAVLELLRQQDHAHKSSGFPWKFLGAGTKIQALKKFGETLDSSHHLLLGTLKDELRLVGKDARLFRFPGLHDYMEGTKLFTVVNEYLALQLFVSPIFAQYLTPGPDLTLLYVSLQQWKGDIYDYDGPAWDANVPLSLVEIICEWRCRLDPSNRRRIRQYYKSMYNGYTIAGGHVFHLIGQPSGHTNTTIDNCLINILAMLYGAWKLDWSYQEFHEQVLYYVCGDDLVWCDRSKSYGAKFLADVRFELGIYSELHGYDPLELRECHFVGTQPIYYDDCLTYTYSLDKLSQSMRWTKKGRSVLDQLSKLVSLQQLTVHDPDAELIRKFAYDYAIKNAEKINLASPEVRGLLRYLTNASYAHMLYTRYESSNGDLKYKPFKTAYGVSFCCSDC